MKKATTKRERKYGKKDDEPVIKPKRKTKTKTKEQVKEEQMYKILVDRANFTQPMTHSDCMKFIEDKNNRATRENGVPPSMTLVLV